MDRKPRKVWSDEEIAEYLSSLKEITGTYGKVAKLLEVNNATVWRGINCGAITPKLRKAFEKRNGLWKTRRRACVEVPQDFTDEQCDLFRQAIRAYAPVAAGQVRRNDG